MVDVTWLNIGLAFFEGLALIVSPCILPILPIILAGSLQGGRKRPLGVIVGFVITFTLFTLFARQLVLSTGVSLNLIRYVSFAVLFLLGCVMVSSYLTEKFGAITQIFGDLGARLSQKNNEGGFVGGLVFGCLVGLIWTPCAGPILAAVIVQSILQHSNIASFFTVLAFGIGAAVPMLLIIIFGRILKNQIQYLNKHSQVIRKVLGWILIITVFITIFGNSPFLISLESTDMITTSGMELKDGLVHPFPAPDFKDISAWINSPPLHIQQLRGKVVLIDFWAYSCINCIRTLPYVLDWYNKYHKDGFEIVGVHSPEFDFERNLADVQAAVRADNIHYPVALDNSYGTWKAYNNLYWPAHYLINKDGVVVYEHFGEGDYDITENNIRYLLGIHGPMPIVEMPEPMAAITPETYLGYERSQRFESPQTRMQDQTAKYTYPNSLSENAWALNGSWLIKSEKIVSQRAGASVKIHFIGKQAFAVMGTSSSAVNVHVKFNGIAVKDQADLDVKNGSVKVDAHRLYRLVAISDANGGELEIIADHPGLEIYTFTFGSK